MTLIDFKFIGGPYDGQIKSGNVEGKPLNETHRLTFREKDGTKLRDAIYMYKEIDGQPTWWFNTYTEWRESDTDASLHRRKRAKPQKNES